MPPRKGKGKRAAEAAEPSEDVEASEVSDTQPPPPKKPRGLGKVTRSRTETPVSVAESDVSTTKGHSIPEDSAREEDIQQEGYPGNISYLVMEGMAAASTDGPPSRVYPLKQRWIHRGEPIINIDDVPEDWNPNDPDLDFNDIDAQIDRCYERIGDGIMPHLFEVRLKHLLTKREARDAMIRSEPDGLSFEVVQRLNALKMIKDHLETHGDTDEQLSNVRALLKAYRERRLGWKQGTVTYWSNGVQLNKPTIFNQELHEKMQQENDPTKSFWVEGLLQSGPNQVGLFGAWPPYNPQQAVKLGLHVTAKSFPNNPQETKALFYEAVHDTGADIMTIPRESLEELESLGDPARVLGWSMAQTAGGIICHKVIELEIALQIPYIVNTFMSFWLKVPAGVIEARPGSSQREVFLSGPFPRFAFFTATCPDGKGFLYLTYSKAELDAFMPERPIDQPHLQLPPAPPYEPSAPGDGPPAHMVYEIKQAAAAAAAAAGVTVVGSGGHGRGRGSGRGRGRGRGRAHGGS